MTKGEDVIPASLEERPVGYAEWLADLNFMRAFAEAWPQLGTIGQQPVDQLPWSYNIKFKTPEDSPTIGLLLCRSKNNIVAEYALRDTGKPMGVAEYQIVESLPKDLESNLPSVERIEQELKGMEE